MSQRSSSARGKDVVWNAQTGHEIKSLASRDVAARTSSVGAMRIDYSRLVEVESGAVVADLGYDVRATLSPDGTKIAAFSINCDLWDVKSTVQNGRFFVPVNEQIRLDKQDTK